MSVFRLLTALLLALCALGSAANAATLDTVRERGHLVCAATNPIPGFAQLGEDGLWSGFDVDMCRAIAAATLGDPNLVEFRPLAGETRFAGLQTGDIDVITRNSEWTMRRDTEYGAHFVAVSFFDGQAIMVPQSMGVVSAYELDDVRVCVVDSDGELGNIREFFFETQASYTEVTYEDREDLAIAYQSGLCNAITAPASWLYAIKRVLADPANHRILPERISRLPLGPVVREGDDEWADIVRITLAALINAEELGVTQLNTESLRNSKNAAIRRLLGLDGDYGTPIRLDPTFMRDVINAVGNYGEIFDRNFGPQTGASLLRGFNSLWSAGGLIYAPPIR